MILFFQKLALKARFVGIIMALLLFVAADSILTNFPEGMARLRQISAGHGLLEEHFWFTPSQARQIFTAWGKPGVEWYLTTGAWLSVLLPLTAAGLFLITCLYFLKKINPRSSGWYLSPFLPLAAGAATLLQILSELLLALFQPTSDFLYYPGAVLLSTSWVLWIISGLFVVFLLGWQFFQRGRRLFRN
ncbi:MAG: hypothetical protein HKM05_02505 [Spirochaetales bacterium]|nr:hypothetical protein [Spirochaetales bacterium]